MKFLQVFKYAVNNSEDNEFGNSYYKGVVELNFRGSVDRNEENKELQLQVESCEVKGVAAELMINGSSPSIQRFVHDDFKMAKVIFAKVEFVENMCRICVRVRLQLDL